MHALFVPTTGRSLQASRGDVIELEEEMTIHELAKKMRTHPCESINQCVWSE